MDKIKGVYKITNNKDNQIYIGYVGRPSYKNAVIKGVTARKNPNNKIKKLKEKYPDIQFSVEVIKETDTNEAEAFIRLYDTVNNGLNVFYNSTEVKESFKKLFSGNKHKQLESL